MDPKLRAALLLNAARAPLEAFQKLADDYGRLEGGGETLWTELGLRPASRKKLADLLRQRDWPERELERVNQFGARFLTAEDPDYPQRLRDIHDPPIGLYVKGKGDLAFPSVAIVGTRRCSSYGRAVAEGLGRALARTNYLVISGGARGIDAAGHRGALQESGATIAVFGTGLDHIYPVEHRGLFEQMLDAGAVVSEYPMGEGGDPWHFPERNRIVVGMAGRTVVVESPEDGGAMISARLALDIGREVWCVPGRINETVCRGTNRLLRDGAQALVDIDEFVQCISGRYGQLMLDLDTSEASATPALSTDEKVLLALLQRQGSRTMDELLAESGLDFAALQTCLLTLTANGLVLASGPGRYSAAL